VSEEEEQLFGSVTPPLRIGYFGLPLGALLLLRDGHELVYGVLAPVAQPGRARLRRHLGPARLVDRSVEGDATERIDHLVFQQEVDLLVSWFYTTKIPAAYLARPRHGGIGVHPSLLPRHRGPDPFYAAIDAGDLETGVTVHELAEEYDTGRILLRRALAIGERDAWQLARALDRPSLSALREVVRAFAEGRPPLPIEQDPGQVSYAPRPEGEALRVDWTWPTARVLRRVRALAPVPGLALEFRGVDFFVTRAVEAPDVPAALRPSEAQLGARLVIRTGDGGISVERACLLVDDEPRELSGAALARWLTAESDQVTET